jgi:Fe-S cluster assembly protein SufD
MALLDALARDFRAPFDALLPLREKALASARRRGLPSLRDEDWKYTDISGLALAPPAEAVSADGFAAEDIPFAAHCAWRVVFVDGEFSAALSSSGTPPAGLRVRPLSAVPTEDPALLTEVFERCARDDAPVFDALNAALSQDGALIELAPEASLPAPVLVAFLNSAGASRAHTAPQLVVRTGARSRLELIEVHHGRPGACNLSNALTDIEAGNASKVAHYRLNHEAPAATHLGSVRVVAAADAEVASHSCAFGGRLTRMEIHAALAARGAHVTLNGLFVAGAGQHIDHQTFIEHRAPHTTSTELYKGIAADDGRGVFRGKVLVHAGAQKISAQQASHNLLLSPTAEIDTKPELEIYADDVACAHGATVGQIDDAALFYLQSRGIGAAEAKALLTFGFAQEVVERIGFEPLRAWLAGELAGRTDVPLPALTEETA